MSVLKLKDKEIKGFQVHFEDEHWREDFGDSFGGGGVRSLRLHLLGGNI